MSQAAFTIIVPVFEETDALAFQISISQSLACNPSTLSIQSAAAGAVKSKNSSAAAFQFTKNPGNCIEDSYQNLAALSPTDWILRVDCDEVPNQAMLDHCARFVQHPKDAYCGFDRDDLIWKGNHFERLKYAPLFVDTQFRLFNRTKVKFLNRIHTPGFHVPKWKLPFLPGWNAPRRARIYHLQRVFISPQQRAEKLVRYNAAGQEQQFNNWLARPDDSFKWRSFHDEYFTQIFAQWKAAQQP